MALLVSLVLFAGPLFLGLDRRDLQNDEAIQSYAVQRMLEAGDWLNPRSIPSDHLLVEKPPLKIWLVAGVPVCRRTCRAIDGNPCGTRVSRDGIPQDLAESPPPFHGGVSSRIGTLLA